MLTLDNTAETALSRTRNDSEGSVDRLRMSCGSRSAGPRWHCVWTHPQREYQALQGLVEQRWDCYLPLTIERGDRINHRPDRITPLWARYLFCQFDPEHDPWGSIQNTAGVGGLVKHAPGRPTALPRGVIESLIARTSSRSVVDDTAGTHQPSIPRGASVAVRDGPLAGLEGICTRSGPERLLVLLRLLGRQVQVELRHELVQVV